MSEQEALVSRPSMVYCDMSLCHVSMMFLGECAGQAAHIVDGRIKNAAGEATKTVQMLFRVASLSMDNAT